jgi:hypothetical protein
MATDPRQDVKADRLFVGEERPRPKPRTRYVLKPVLYELGDCLAFSWDGKSHIRSNAEFGGKLTERHFPVMIGPRKPGTSQLRWSAAFR